MYGHEVPKRARSRLRGARTGASRQGPAPALGVFVVFAQRPTPRASPHTRTPRRRPEPGRGARLSRRVWTATLTAVTLTFRALSVIDLMVRHRKLSPCDFCTRELGSELENTLRHSGTATHHPYRRLNLVCISLITHIACAHVHARQRPQWDLRRARAALAGPGATTQHPHASPDPPGAASKPPRRPNGRRLAAAAGTPNEHQSEGAAERPADHTAGVRCGPARSVHGARTPAHAADVPGRLRAPVAARERRNGRCSAPGAPDGGPVGGLLAARQWRARLRARRGRGRLGRAWHGLWAGAARRQRRLRWAALAAVARRARMRRFDFSHVARTSLGRSRRAAETLPRAGMATAEIAGTVAIGLASLVGRAPRSVASVRAYRTTGARRDRADGTE